MTFSPSVRTKSIDFVASVALGTPPSNGRRVCIFVEIIPLAGSSVSFGSSCAFRFQFCLFLLAHIQWPKRSGVSCRSNILGMTAISVGRKGLRKVRYELHELRCTRVLGYHVKFMTADNYQVRQEWSRVSSTYMVDPTRFHSAEKSTNKQNTSVYKFTGPSGST